MTRKRKFCDATDTVPRKKRVQTINIQSNKHEHIHNDNHSMSHELLSLYYPRILSLRQFLLSSLPLLSPSHRRRLTTYGCDSEADTRNPHFFDSTLVGVFSEPQTTVREARKRDFIAFTQLQQKSAASSNGSTQGPNFTEVGNLETRTSHSVGLRSTDIFRSWNLLSGRSFTEQNPRPRNRTIYCVMVSSEAQRTLRKTRGERSPA